MELMEKKHLAEYACLDRRTFLKLMAIASAGTALPWRFARDALGILSPGPHSQVILRGIKRRAEDHQLVEAVKEAARAATDFSWLSRGDIVLIKPALNSGNPYPATTSPAGIRAVVELLRERGARKVIVSDMSGVEHVKLSQEKLKGSSRELMKESGMAEAAIKAGAELYFPEEDGWDAFFEDGPSDSSYWKGAIMMPKILKEVDHIVLMPRCGRHVLLGSSLGMKAVVGYWRTDSRLDYHKGASTIQEKTADANTVSSILDKQRLVLTTATKILTTFGPDKGAVSEPQTGLVIASESVVAHDMVSLAWLIMNRASLPVQKSYRDPYKSQFLVNNINRLVVGHLGGLTEVWGTEKLVRNDLAAIWDDRVLSRAFEVFGGVPRVALFDEDNTVPAGIKKKLEKMLVKPFLRVKD